MIRALLKNRVAKNASWIIICKIAQAVLGLIISVLTARYLGPANYGVISYAQSLATFITPIAQLGFTSTLVHELVNHPEHQGEVMGSAIRMSVISSILCMAMLIGFVSLSSPEEPETILVCGLYSLVLLMQSLELIQYWFQARLLSKYSAVLTLIAYAVMSVYQVVILITQKSVIWFAIAKAIEYCIVAVFLLVIYHRLSGQKLRWNGSFARKMIAHSRPFMLSSVLVMTFAQADRLMIKMMMGNTPMGYYSAAVACANLTDFVFIALIDSMRPMILKEKLVSASKYEKGMVLLYGVVIYLALLQSLFITAFAKPIVGILYGNDYLYSVRALQIIVWYTAFSYMGMARNVWILGEGKERLLVLINLCGAICNIVLNAFLIPYWGIEGAALASLITQIFTNWGLGYLIPVIRPNNRLIRQSLNLRNVFGLLRQMSAE